MEDLLQAVKGMGWLAVAYLAHAWALVYPIVTGSTAAFAFIVTGHAVCRLIWRWWHGYPNFLTEHELHVENPDDGDC